MSVVLVVGEVLHATLPPVLRARAAEIVRLLKHVEEGPPMPPARTPLADPMPRPRPIVRPVFPRPKKHWKRKTRRGW